MIVNSERTIALTCPACQVIQEHVFSLFVISQQPFQLVCSCGFSQGHLTKVNRNYKLDVLTDRGDRVRILLPKDKFFYSPLYSLSSPAVDQNLGYLGSPHDVHQAVTEASISLPEFGHFSNPQIMREILKNLQVLAKQQRIRCECEHSSIGIDVYADRVELVCSFCGSVIQIEASTKEHQERISRITEIIMEQCSAQQLLGEWLKPLT